MQHSATYTVKIRKHSYNKIIIKINGPRHNTTWSYPRTFRRQNGSLDVFSFSLSGSVPWVEICVSTLIRKVYQLVRQLNGEVVTEMIDSWVTFGRSYSSSYSSYCSLFQECVSLWVWGDPWLPKLFLPFSQERKSIQNYIWDSYLNLVHLRDTQLKYLISQQTNLILGKLTRIVLDRLCYSKCKNLLK